MRPMSLWYAGYGSNLSPERFGSYLTGGAVQGTPDGWAEQGSRDSSAPRDVWTGTVQLATCFAGSSQRWGGGGVGFVDPHGLTRDTHVRAYLISIGQFEDLHRQENRVDTPVPLDLDALLETGSVESHPDCSYSHALRCGTHADGRPIVVVAGTNRPELAVPDRSYLRVMAFGLGAGFGLTTAQIASYLASWPGAAGTLSDEDVLGLIA